MTGKIKTYLGELRINYLFANSLGYFAVTGTAWCKRIWNLNKQEFEKLKKEITEK